MNQSSVFASFTSLMSHLLDKLDDLKICCLQLAKESRTSRFLLPSNHIRERGLIFPGYKALLGHAEKNGNQKFHNMLLQTNRKEQKE